MRDLAAVSLLHGLWDGRDVRDIADGLCGTVYRLLDLDLAAVRLDGGVDPGADRIVVRYPADVDAADALLDSIEPALEPGGSLPPGIVAHRLDFDGLRAVAVGRSARLGFPSDVEALIFRAVANEASVAVRASRRLEAARSARRTLEAVVEQMPIGVAIAEAPGGRIIARNAALDRLLPHAGSDAAPPEDASQPLRRSIELGEVVTDEEIEMRSVDGRRSMVSVSSAPVRDASGSIVAAVATYADITARREADGVRDAFISMLSHELRTPITSIYAAAHLLRRPVSVGLDDARRRGIVEDIAIESERLDRIVQNFLVLARVERGATIGSHEPVLVQRLVPRLMDRERERWPDRSFSADMPPDLPPVAADELSLELVVRNLVNNAAKYGGPGASVQIVGRRDLDRVHVEVLDDGPGLDTAEADHVFDLFYRSDRLAPKAEGAGVGLYVVRSAVEAMGGAVWAGPRADGGAKFGFSLAMWLEEAPQGALEERSLTAPA